MAMFSDDTKKAFLAGLGGATPDQVRAGNLPPLKKNAVSAVPAIGQGVQPPPADEGPGSGIGNAVAGIGEYGARVAAMPILAAKDVANKTVNGIAGIGNAALGAVTGYKFPSGNLDTGSTDRNLAAMGTLQGEALGGLGASPVRPIGGPAAATPAVKVAASSAPTIPPIVNPMNNEAAFPTSQEGPYTDQTPADTAVVPPIGGVPAKSPLAIVNGPLDAAAAGSLHDRVDYSAGSKNALDATAKATYNDEVAKAVRVNAASGLAPSAEQIRTLGMSNADVTNLLSANNHKGQFNTAITAMMEQQKMDANTTNAAGAMIRDIGAASLNPSLIDVNKANAVKLRAESVYLPQAQQAHIKYLNSMGDYQAAHAALAEAETAQHAFQISPAGQELARQIKGHDAQQEIEKAANKAYAEVIAKDPKDVTGAFEAAEGVRKMSQGLIPRAGTDAVPPDKGFLGMGAKPGKAATPATWVKPGDGKLTNKPLSSY